MITLTELLHSINSEKKDGFLHIDNWKWPDVDHLVTMGFDFGDDYHMQTTKDPKMSIYIKKEKSPETGKEEMVFHLDEKGRESKRFKSFGDLIDFFDTYSQPEIDKNME